MKLATWCSLTALALGACASPAAEPDAGRTGFDPADASPDAEVEEPPGFDIVLIAGQSNAVGIGLGPVVPLTDDEALLAARIDQLGRFGVGGADDGEVIAAVEPLAHWANDPIANPAAAERRGFGYAFAMKLAATTAPNRRVLLVPTARGGTSILQWNRVESEFAGDTSLLWDDMRLRTERALATGDGENRLVAILWHQAESDINAALNPASAIGAVMDGPERYAAELERLLGVFRNSFSDQGCVPLMLGEVAPSWVPAGTDAVATVAMRDQFMDVIHQVSADTPCSAVIESDGLTSNAEDLGTTDTIHFSAASQRTFGERYYEAYEGLR